jgi:gas vesicle protein
MAEERSGGESVLWFIVGGLLGAGAALLLAPTSGEQTRAKLGDWLNQAEKGGRRLLHEGREKIRKSTES